MGKVILALSFKFQLNTPYLARSRIAVGLQPVGGFDTLTLFPRTLGPCMIVVWKDDLAADLPPKYILLWYTSMTSSNHQNSTCLPASEMRLHLNGGHRQDAMPMTPPDQIEGVRAPPLRACRPRSSIKKKWQSIQFWLLRCFLCPPRPLPLWTALLSRYIVPEPLSVAA